MKTELKRPLPPDRSFEQVKNHYLVEKSIADELKNASKEERILIYRTMYDRMFKAVPDHPRLKKREDKKCALEIIEDKLRFFGKFISNDNIVLEFAPGDCLFANKLCKKCEKVIGVDISDQRNRFHKNENNFELIVYDGFSLNLSDKLVDVVISDQLIEHIHPDDFILHLNLVNRVLKSGGTYVFRTPHAFSGPHDVSKYFSNKAKGFHLKEYVFNEIIKPLIKSGFSKTSVFFGYKGRYFRVPNGLYLMLENIFEKLPNVLRLKYGSILFKSLAIVAKK